MFDHWLRMLKDRLFEPIAPAIGRWAHPNAITLLGFLAGLVAALLAAQGRTVGSFAAWATCRTLDGLDGSVARATGRQSDFGGYLDTLTDFVVYAAVPVGVLLGHPAEAAAWHAGLFLLASFYINAASWMYLAAILERRNRGAAATGERTTVTMPPAIVAGTETVIFYSALLLVPAWATGIFWLMGSLVLLNVIVRLVWAWRRI